MTSDEIYLDHNATAPLLPDVAEAVREALRDCWANPASVHGAGRRARAHLDDCREAIAERFGRHHREVLLTSGGTEANNLALLGAPGLVTSRIEHPSVVRVAEHLRALGRPVHWLPVHDDGRIRVSDVERALGSAPAGSVVAVMAVNHETGVVQPIPDVAALCRSRGRHLHVDAVQALGKVEDAVFAGATSYAVAAHKLGGPQGIGALVWEGPPPTAMQFGGKQERGIRPGTQSAPLAAGFAVAVRASTAGPPRHTCLAPLRDRLERFLGAHGRVNGSATERAPHVTNVSVRGWAGAEVVASADLLGVRISSGSACSEGTPEPSPVIEAMVGAERARSAVRISLGLGTSEADVDRGIAVLRHILAPASLT